MSERIVVITGAYGHLGRCFVEAFKEAGDTVVLTGRDPGRLEACARELSCRHRQVLDVTDGGQIEALRARLAKDFGRVDVLVNNAGRMGAGGPLERVDPAQVAEMLLVNIHGPFALTRALLELLDAAPAALVVNVASTSGHRADAHSAAYNASKFGLLGLTEALRKDLRTRGIRVTSLSPSSIEFDPDAPLGGKGARLHGDDIAATARWLADAPPRTLVRDIELWATNP